MDDALYAEADAVQQAGREYVLAVSGVLSLLLLVLGAGVSFGLVGGREPVLILLPFLVTALLIYMLQLITEYRARLGIRRAIENHLTKLPVNERLVSGTVLAAVVGSRRVSVEWSAGLFALGVVAVDLVAGVAAYREFGLGSNDDNDWWRWPAFLGYVIVLLLSLGSLVPAASEARAAEDLAYDETTSLLATPDKRT